MSTRQSRAGAKTRSDPKNHPDAGGEKRAPRLGGDIGGVLPGPEVLETAGAVADPDGDQGAAGADRCISPAPAGNGIVGAASIDFRFGMKKGDAAYHAVRRSILLGRLGPGDALIEQKIAEEINCSQGTVREALLRLEQDGLVARRGYRGTVVSATSIDEAAEMVRIRVQLECLAIARSLPLSDCAVAALFALADEMDAATRAGDYYRCSELDRDFHMLLFRQAGLSSLDAVLNRCALHVHRFTFMNAEAVAPDPRLGDIHRALIGDFERTDAAGACGLIKAHIQRVMRRFAPPLEAAVERAARAFALDCGPD